MFLVLLLLVGVLAVASARAGVVRPRVEVDAAAMPVLLAAATRGRLAFAAGVVVGLVAAAALWVEDPAGPGRAAALAPLLAVLVTTAAVCLAELTAPRPRGTVRSASVAPRSAHDVVPAGLLRSALAGPLALVVLLVLGWTMGSADDLGRAGRALVTSCGPVSSARSPWPGSFYAVPMLAGLLAVVAVAGATLAAIVRRPSPGVAGESGDAALRRASARRVLLVAGAGVSLVAAPVGGLMGLALLQDPCGTTGFGALGVVCLATGLLSAVHGAWLLGSAMAGPRLVVRERA